MDVTLCVRLQSRLPSSPCRHRGHSNANDDFSALLADLSFGDAPSLNRRPTGESLTVVQEETLQDLMPLPAGLSMPGMLESTPGPAAVFTPAGPQVVAQESSAEQPAPQVALMDPVRCAGSGAKD